MCKKDSNQSSPQVRVVYSTGHIALSSLMPELAVLEFYVFRSEGDISVMWYVIWTTTGCEQKLGLWIKDYVPADYYDDCFVPLIDQNKKINGVWKTVHKTLFPGYLFVNTDDERIEAFAERIRHSDQFAVVLSTDERFAPVNDEEVFLIENAYANNGVLGSSIGIIEGEHIKILSGPLIGKEGLIKSINRHKRTAIIELSMFGRVSKIKIGLEIISKL